jgi:hypothetical protein
MAKIGDIVEGTNTNSVPHTATQTLTGSSKAQPTELEVIALENAKLEQQRLKLELLEKQANIQDLQERLNERELRRETKRQRSLTNGATLKQLAQQDTAAQKRCNHRKGGDGLHAIVGGQGQDSQYAVMKHTFCNGDMWVRCLRCGKTWKPPVKEVFATEQDFLKAVVDYETAVNFQTRNVASGSIQFRFSDNGAFYREVTASTNLR